MRLQEIPFKAGHQTGINLNGSHNKISQNVVVHYNSIGILMNGYHNLQSHNILQGNQINLIENDLKEPLIDVPKDLED